MVPTGNFERTGPGSFNNCEPANQACQDVKIETLYQIAQQTMDLSQKVNRLLEDRIDQYVFGCGSIEKPKEECPTTHNNRIDAIRIFIEITGQTLNFIANNIEDKLVKELKKL
jgi:hypothetical protein